MNNREPFTDGQIWLIRVQDYQYGVDRKKLAKRYGVSPYSVTAILHTAKGKYTYRPDITIDARVAELQRITHMEMKHARAV